MKCVAWGCQADAIAGGVPDPRYAEALKAGHGVPWYQTCGRPIQRSASGLTFVHPKRGRGRTA